MISPETSGEILISSSGWIFPVALTSCVIVRTTALSVVTAMPCWLRCAFILAPTARAMIKTTPARMNHFSFDFFFLAGAVAAGAEPE